MFCLFTGMWQKFSAGLSTVLSTGDPQVFQSYQRVVPSPIHRLNKHFARIH